MFWGIIFFAETLTNWKHHNRTLSSLVLIRDLFLICALEQELLFSQLLSLCLVVEDVNS